MQARLFLILLSVGILVVLLTNGNMELFLPFEFILFERKVKINSEIVIALIMLATLLITFIVGIISKLFFSRSLEKAKKRKI
tara:strand:- start:1279 stop:1524 length:246 start_codon:yes stop_codon:yes gene_type:complete